MPRTLADHLRDLKNAASQQLKGAAASAGRPLPPEPEKLSSEPTLITKPSGMSDKAWDAIMQGNAVLREASNVVTFGGADRFDAGVNALLAPGGFHDLGRRYRANLAQEFARDQYDATNRPFAHGLGDVAGLAAGLAASGPLSLASTLGARLPGAAALTGREAAAVLGAGGASGLAAQTFNDMLTGNRSTTGDKVGATVGGIAGAAALPLGLKTSGAVDGWVTSASQDVFNQRPIALDQASESALTGAMFASAAGRLGRNASQRLPRNAKGKLGEAMGEVRSTINGERRTWGPKARDPLPGGGYWYPDGRSGQVRFEDKFGFAAKLSKQQIKAMAALGANFRLNHFTPDDVGGLLGLVAGPAGSHLPQRPSTDPPPANNPPAIGRGRYPYGLKALRGLVASEGVILKNTPLCSFSFFRVISDRHIFACFYSSSDRPRRGLKMGWIIRKLAPHFLFGAPPMGEASKPLGRIFRVKPLEVAQLHRNTVHVTKRVAACWRIRSPEFVQQG